MEGSDKDWEVAFSEFWKKMMCYANQEKPELG